MRALEATLRETMVAFHWCAIAAVAAMLWAHLMAVWGIVAVSVPEPRRTYLFWSRSAC